MTDNFVLRKIVLVLQKIEIEGAITMSYLKVEMFTSPICPYCVRAKSLLERKGADYQEIDISNDPDLREEVIKRSGGRTSVPQIFINDFHVGGADDLYALDSEGKLDELLKSA